LLPEPVAARSIRSLDQGHESAASGL